MADPSAAVKASLAPPRELRRGAVLAVGSELVAGLRAETNTQEIAAALTARGVDVVARIVVRDSEDELTETLQHARGLADLVIVTGGLGPTDDDVTRTAVGRALALPLAEDPIIVEHIRARFARRGLPMPEINRRQAHVLQGAIVLPNPNGTAPGQVVIDEAGAVAMLPGPPRELRPMLAALFDGPLVERLGTQRLFRREVRVAGRSESWVEERMHPLYARWRAREPAVDATILAAPSQIELHLSVWSRDAAQAATALDEAAGETASALGESVFTTDGEPLEGIVGDLLRARGYRIAVAESCTGGLLGARLTNVPGSSAYFDRGVVAYSNDAKVDLVGVDPALIDRHGAVSEEVALALASGVRSRAGVEVGVAITGVAGPTGGTDTKPVGMVVIAVETPAGAEARTLQFPGDRWSVRAFAVQTALDLVRRRLSRQA